MAETSTGDGTTTSITEVSQLPEFAQTMIKELRDEAAKHRTSKNEAVSAAVEAAKAEVTSEWEAKLAEAQKATETAQGEANTNSLALAKLRTALGARVPETVFNEIDIFAGRLNGSTPDEIKADADGLKKLVGPGWGGITPANDPSPEGKAPTALNDDDGLLNALMGAVGVRPTD